MSLCVKHCTGVTQVSNTVQVSLTDYLSELSNEASLCVKHCTGVTQVSNTVQVSHTDYLSELGNEASLCVKHCTGVVDLVSFLLWDRALNKHQGPISLTDTS